MTFFQPFSCVCVCVRERKRPKDQKTLNRTAIIIGNEPFLVLAFLSIANVTIAAHFFSVLFKSSSFGCFTKCMTFFGLPCELFELQAICIEKLFFFFFRFALLYFFMIYFVCGFVCEPICGRTR